MAIIRFKTRSLIKRFGTKPVRVPDNLAKQYLDRGQAVPVRKSIAKIEEVEEEIIEEIEEVEEEEEAEEKMEIKIKKPKK